MRKTLTCTCLAVLLVGPSFCQSSATTEEDTLRQLRDAVAALQQARDELQQTRQEMNELRQEVASLRSDLKGPQTPVPAETGERIARLEEEQQIQSSRLEQQYQTKVESGSKYRVRLSGLVLFNSSMNRGSVNDQDVPNLALVVPEGASGGNVSASLRQTLLTLEVFGPQVAGARTSAQATFDFFGGFAQTLDGTTLGLARLRTARAEFAWKHWDLTVGQEQPFISPRNPTSLASVAVPALGYSGNMWTWTPQVVVRRRWNLTETTGSTTEFGFLDPLAGDFPSSEYSRQPGAGERSRVPAIAFRQAFSTRLHDEDAQIGVGGYYARHDYGYQRNTDAWAATLDWSLPVSSWFQWSGEFFRGRALGGLWGGVGTSVVYTDYPSNPATRVVPVEAVGGWTQLKFKPNQKLEFNAAFGQDNPFASDLRQQGLNATYSPILRNQTAIVNVIQRLRSNLLLSLEYRHLNSNSLRGNRNTAEHLNAAVGVEF